MGLGHKTQCNASKGKNGKGHRREKRPAPREENRKNECVIFEWVLSSPQNFQNPPGPFLSSPLAFVPPLRSLDDVQLIPIPIVSLGMPKRGHGCPNGAVGGTFDGRGARWYGNHIAPIVGLIVAIPNDSNELA